MAGERWTFTKSQLDTTPSRKCGIDGDKELTYRQQAANLIQDMGQRLQVTQLCINTAIVYMHRFYMFQSFTKFHRNPMAAACLFLAAKVEEQPRKLEHVIKVSHLCLNRDGPQLDIKSVAYLEQAHELVINENILLQTLGFDLSIDHPHTNVVKTCQLVKASKDLAQTSYFLATNSLHLTTLCLQYKPTVVACVCVHLACKWSNWEIPKSVEGKEWFYYVDKSVTTDLLHDLTQDFLKILDKCPSKLRRKIMTWKSGEKRDIKDEIDAGSEKPSKSGTTGDGTASSSSSAPSGSGTSKSSKPHHHTASSHDHKSEKHPESSHVKQESHGSLVKHSSDHAAATHSSTSGATHTHGKNVFDVLTRDKIKYEKAESQQPSLSRATSAPIVPVVQKTSLAEYKERREREKQAALLNKSANAMETDKKLTIKQEPVSGRSAMLDATETVKKHHDPSEREKVKKSHHDRHHHGRHGVEAVPGSEIKLRIKTEPGVSAESSLRGQDSKTWKTESSSALESLKGPETKLRIKKEPGLIPEEISKGMETKIRKSDSNAMSEGTPKGSDTKLRIKSDPDAYVEGSKGSDMKIRIKKEPSLTQKGSSPLKLKIKTSHLPKEKHHSEKSYSVGSSSSHHSSHSEQRVPPMKLSVHPSKVSSGDESLSKHSGREGHHKPHKSSKHSSHSSSGSGGSSHSGTNGKSELKIHISMSEINRQQGGASDAGKMTKSSKHGRDSDKHKQSSKSQNDISKSELSWTSSESLDVNSELSRKRPHSPSDMLSNDLQQRNKVHKSESTTRLRRSSSNHSVVSMDLSDSGLDGYGGIDNDLSAQGIETNGSGKNSPCVETARKQIQVLQQAIEFQKAQIAAQVHHSSPSGVLLHHQAPPLPQAQPPPPPPPPSTQLFQFSSASQQYGYQPIESLCDIDFLADDTMPPLPGEQPPLPPSPSMQPPPPPY